MQGFIRKTGLVAECAALTIGVPLLMDAFLPLRYLLPAIWAVTLYCCLVARICMHEPLSAVWRRQAVTRDALVPILLRFALCALLMTLFTWQAEPALLFNFVSSRPLFWLLVMFLYPLLSVIPQEIIFRSFFLTRYQPLFPKPWLMVLVSAFTFAFAHLLFHNWVAPSLCLIGGLMFAHTYRKHQSLLLVVLEHALYGNFLFTVGLGRYFFHGSVAAAAG